MEQSSLHKILKNCRQKQRRAQKELYDYSFPYLMRIALRFVPHREEAAQLVNQAFLKVLLQLDHYDEERPFLPWAGQIAVRCAIDDYRQRCRQRLDYLDQEAQQGHEALRLNPQVLDHLAWEDLQKMIAQLPAAQRIVFNLKEWEGYSHREIAAELQCSERSSKRHLEAAKRQLKTLLQDYYDLKTVS